MDNTNKNEEKEKKEKKEFECENCGKIFNSLKRKNNHFKICNYDNLQKKITDLEFKLFNLQSYNDKLLTENKIHIQSIDKLLNDVDIELDN
jgi:methionyl-tRNA synthetase